MLVFVFFGLLGAALTIARPEFMRHFFGPEMIATMERHTMWTESVVSVAPMASSAIMTNNLSVSFVTFAGGIVFGLGTFFALFENGMMLGVIGAACHHYEMSLKLWSFVAPHGSLELPSIFIAGGAGFRLGHAMLFPGALRWKESVARGGVEATQLVSGIIPLLVIAGYAGGLLLPLARPRLAQVHRRRTALYPAQPLALPPGESACPGCVNMQGLHRKARGPAA